MDVFTGNKGKNIIHWIGTDIYDLYWHCSFEKLRVLRKWFKENNVIHLCEADFTQKELKEIGIDAKIVPIPPKLYEAPLPKEFTVGVYQPESETYNPALMVEVTKSLPDVKFIFFGNDEMKGIKGDNWEHVGYVDFDEYLPKMSCNLRITNHDGLPLAPLQFLASGRNVVTNTPLKGAIQVKKDRSEIVAGIRKAQKEPLDKKISKYWKKELSPELYRKRIRRLYV